MNWDNELKSIMPALRRYAFFLTRNAAEADDLVNDTIVRILSAKSTFDQNRMVRPWALRILRNLFVDSRRKHSAQENFPSGDIAELADLASARKPLERLELRDALDAIDQLQEPFREVLLLVSIEECSYAETARCLDIPIGTVMSRLARARRKLNEILDRAPTQIN